MPTRRQVSLQRQRNLKLADNHDNALWQRETSVCIAQWAYVATKISVWQYGKFST